MVVVPGIYSTSPTPRFEHKETPNSDISFNEPASPAASLLGILIVVILLFTLGKSVFQSRLAALPGMDKKRILILISIFTLCITVGIIYWSDLYYVLYNQNAVTGMGTDTFVTDLAYTLGILRKPTYFTLLDACLPAVILFFIVMTGKLFGKLFSLPTKRQVIKTTLVLYAATMTVITLSLPMLGVLNTALSAPWSGSGTPGVIVSVVILTVITFVLGLLLFGSHLSALFHSQKRKVFIVPGVIALFISCLSIPLHYSMSQSDFISFYIVPLFVIVCTVTGKMVRKLLQIPVKKQSAKLACVLYPVITVAILGITYMLVIHLRFALWPSYHSNYF